jgi:hypothetical protein
VAARSVLMLALWLLMRSFLLVRWLGDACFDRGPLADGWVVSGSCWVFSGSWAGMCEIVGRGGSGTGIELIGDGAGNGRGVQGLLGGLDRNSHHP